MVPTGFAFTEHGYSPEPNEVAAFLDQVKAMGLKAANFWEWSSARGSLPKVWNKISDYPWPSLPAEKDLTERYIEALNAHDPVRVALVYTETGVHVNAARTVQGMASLLGWYNALFNTILPNTTFVRTGVSGSGNSRHLTWTATSSTGNVMNGNDTFGLLDGKIAYHYTFFTVG